MLIVNNLLLCYDIYRGNTRFAAKRKPLLPWQTKEVSLLAAGEGFEVPDVLFFRVTA